MEYKLSKIIIDAEDELKDEFAKTDSIALFNQNKILNAFRDAKFQTHHYAGTTGYGYADTGREYLNKIYAQSLGAKSAYVGTNIACGTTALHNAFFAILRPGDIMLSISGKPYDSLDDVIFSKNGEGSLADFNIDYKQVELNEDGNFNTDDILKAIDTYRPKLVFIQRSRGYSTRDSLNISKLEAIITKIRRVMPNQIIMIDNCYGELTETREPTEVGASLIVGSLIKNAGGGFAPCGAYFVGDKKIIDLVSARINSVGLKDEVGSLEAGYRNYFQGFFMAPITVANAVKGAKLIAHVFRKLGYNALPKKDSISSDTVCSVEFKDKDKMIKFIQTIQKFSPVDSSATPVPWAMPGYADEVIMAAGTFVSGATSEMSADAPVREPYIAYLQGGLTMEHIKIVLNESIKEL